MILVTGATGKVGRELVAMLAENGSGVRALTRDPGSADLPPGVDTARGDLSDPAALGRSLRWEELERDEAHAQLTAAFGDAAFAESGLNTWAGFAARPSA